MGHSDDLLNSTKYTNYAANTSSNCVVVRQNNTHQSINQSISFILTPHFSNNMNQGCLQAIGKRLNMLIKLSNRRAIGEHTSTAVNCIPPAEVALNLAFGDFERNGDIWALGEG